MSPSVTFFSDLALRSHFICRSCSVSIQAAQRAAARPRWPAAAAALQTTATTTTAGATSVRTITSQATTARSRAGRSGPGPQQHAEPFGWEGRSAGSEAASAKETSQANRDDDVDDGEDGDGGDYTVRYFDQGDDGKVRLVGDSDGADSISNLNAELKQQLSELESKLRETMALAKTLGKNAPVKRRAERLRKRYNMIKEVEREADNIGDDVAEAAAAAALVKIDDTGLTVNARRHVKNLNSILRAAVQRLGHTAAAGGADSGGVGIDTKLITALWSRYGAARAGLAEAWGNVPTAAWTCLWDVLAWDDSATDTSTTPTAKNPRRMAHIYYLAKDMQAAGVALTDAQQLLAMEAMFVEGWPADALDNWKRTAATLGTRPATATDYWELGVRMCARHGDLERAERAASRLFSDDYSTARSGARVEEEARKGNPRVLFQLIRSAAARDAQDTAWTAYQQLRALIDGHAGSTADHEGMTIEDYDEVVSCFLTANQTEAAFAVFVDMMFSGARAVHRPARTAGALPSAVANHFFFGKWLKRLIGAGDLDGAYRVLLFMQARGVMPAAVQVNGLLGAWLRSGTAANQALADAVAWRMIASRQLFVSLRQREAQMEWPLKLHQVAAPTRRTSAADDNAVDKADGKADADQLTFVPRASLETFALMADNYKNRGRIGQLEDLWAAFRACEMAATDAFMLNQLLGSYVHEGRVAEAHDLYRRMVHGGAADAGGSQKPVVPNPHTFLELFRSLAVHRQLWQSLTDEQCTADAALCRKLVADLVKFGPAMFPPQVFAKGSSSSTDHSKAEQDDAHRRAAGVVQALGRLVLHSFRKAGDYVGLLVCLQALPPLLRGQFDMSESLAIELVAESTDLGRDSPAMRRRIFKASEVVEALLRERHTQRQQQRQQRPPHDGDDSLSPAAFLSADLAAAVAHVYRLKCTGVPDEAFEAMCDAAVKDMRLGAFV
ncbi:pentatricopeptide repeat protein [Niveomyces insectorum RCEF 264]|uniref:Pentatricopeptide repeat protein n=1 Tax=Niveomyces insectorum RCEF 264 TaxID=1081102 RepID=A0A167WE79_9HYPO|nr:pentatricopeptide repeat protein [Niveomyces insectorum RCEF 264]